jgi:hypothetical protein
MELAVNYDEKRAKKAYPAHAQMKYDGVPLTLMRNADMSVSCLTRQNEQPTSVQHLVSAANELLPRVSGASFVGECLLPGASFKDSSGAIRRHEPNAKIVCIVFDANLNAQPKLAYHQRFLAFRDTWQLWRMQQASPCIFPCPTTVVEDHDAAMAEWDRLKAKMPHAEGMMLHTCTKPFSPGKRAPGMLRYKPQPTIDLSVAGFEEAISETGEPLNMVGRVNVTLTRRGPDGWEPADKKNWQWLAAARAWRTVVGVGPGKLDHKQRTELWSWFKVGMVPSMVEVKYMPDPTYDALRQPTIQRIRTDKEMPDVLSY